MALLIFYACISIFFSFLCSILEAVLLSVTPTFINVKKQEGKSYATDLEDLKKDVDRPLIAILTLNTIAHTVGAILVGTQAETIYGAEEGGSFLTSGVFWISAIMTFLILVASEIIPKTIGATYWKGLANFTTKALKLLMFPLKWTGILWLLQLTTKLIGKGGHGESVLSREDFSAMADIGAQEGVFRQGESRIIKNLLTFGVIQAKDIMTPRMVVVAADENMLIKDFYEAHPNLRFSRIPIYQENKDKVDAFFLKDELLAAIINKKGDQPLSTISRQIMIVPEQLSLQKLFNQLMERREHVALVVGEFGGMSGLVTMEDVIETLLGLEIMDEMDNIPDMQLLARKNWEKRAKAMGILSDKDSEDEATTN